MCAADTIANNTQTEGYTPAVSVIMPAYNVAEYIGEALDSVLAQTFTDYEIIVVNDGSSDTNELERVLEPYRERIVYIKQQNRGLSGARNTALRSSSGRYIALLDPDDIWEPEYLAVQVAKMESDPTMDVLYPNALLFGKSPNAGKTFMDICPSKGEVTFEHLVTEQCHVCIFITARREAIIQAGLFDESLRSCEDFDLWLRIVKQGGRIGYHHRVLARHRRRPESLSSNHVRMHEHILRVLEKASRTLDLTPKERTILEQQRVYTGAMLSLYKGKQAFTSGDTRAAIDHLTGANNFFKSRKIRLVLLLLRFAPSLLLFAYHLRDRLIFREARV